MTLVTRKQLLKFSFADSPCAEAEVASQLQRCSHCQHLRRDQIAQRDAAGRHMMLMFLGRQPHYRFHIFLKVIIKLQMGKGKEPSAGARNSQKNVDFHVDQVA